MPREHDPQRDEQVEWAKGGPVRSGEVVSLPAGTRISPMVRISHEMGYAVIREVPYAPDEVETEVLGMRAGTVWLPRIKVTSPVHLLLYALTPQTGPLAKFVVRSVGTNDTVFDPGQYLGSFNQQQHEFHVFVRRA